MHSLTDLLPNFSTRSDETEWMDDLSLPPETLRDTTDAVERINRVCGGVQVTLRGLDALVPTTGRGAELSVLDVGTGNGALPRDFVDWGRRRGLQIHATGIDLIPSAVAIARRRARRGGYEQVDYRVQNLFDIAPGDSPADDGRFDIVHASLVLHHFPGDEAVAALRKMAELARLGVVINDLHRHPLHWLGSQVLIPSLSRDELARHDGPISVLRGFTRRELLDLADRAGLTFASTAWEPPFRWLLVAPT